jgi:hypothetical protein
VLASVEVRREGVGRCRALLEAEAGAEEVRCPSSRRRQVAGREAVRSATSSGSLPPGPSSGCARSGWGAPRRRPEKNCSVPFRTSQYRSVSLGISQYRSVQNFGHGRAGSRLFIAQSVRHTALDMGRRWRPKAITDMDQALPWDEGLELVGSVTGGELPVPDPLGVASATTRVEGAERSATGDERKSPAPPAIPTTRGTPT